MVGKKKSMTNEDIIFDYLKRNPHLRKKELIEELVHKTPKKDNRQEKRLMSYGTFHKHIKNLLNSGKVFYSKLNKTYTINTYNEIPNYFPKEKPAFINSETQINEKELEELKLYKALELESILLKMLDTATTISYNIGNKKGDKIYLSDFRWADMRYIVQYLIREIVIMNPETWKILTVPEDLSFSFSISCDATKEILILEKLNEIKEIYLGIKKVFEFKILSNFKDKFEVEYAKEDVTKFLFNRTVDEIYKNAVAEQTLREKRGVKSLWK